jgi:hypothetical protein
VPAGIVLLWLSLSSTPVTVNGTLSIGAISLCGWGRLRRWSVWLSAPAALAVGAIAPHRENWVPLFVAAFVWRGAVSMARLDEESAGSGIVPALYGISAVGALVCLPDTEQVLVLAVVAVATAIAALVEPRVAFGRSGSMALVGMFGWIAATGGIGRPAAIVGALGSLGVLVLAGGLALPSNRLLVVAHSGCVAACSRVAGISRDVRFAVIVVGLALSLTLCTVVLSARRWPFRLVDST